jgi:hypothetical protein
MTLLVAISLLPMQAPVQFRGEAQLGEVVREVTEPGWEKLPVGELMGRIGISLVGTPYVGWTLEVDPANEFCFVTMQGLDCVTFFETSLAIARILRSQARSGAMPKVTGADLVKQVTFTRYRGGTVDGYLSRLHYTGDWMLDNVKKGTVAWVDQGASPFRLDYTFMSKNQKVYKQLAGNPDLVPQLQRHEARLSAVTFRYYPKSEVGAVESSLKTGDIVGITTTMPGMDCSHTGMIVRRGSRAVFLHASSTKKRVTFDVPISEYLARSEKNTGILVVRPREP